MTASSRWAFGAFFFLYFAYIGLMSPYASLYFSELGFGAIEIAALMSMLQVTRILGPFSWGWLSDYLSNRVSIMRFCGVLAVLCFFVIFYLEQYIPFLIWMFILHTILSSMVPLGEAATVHALFKDNSFDHRYGRLRLWGSIGFIAMVLLAGEVFQWWGIEVFPWLGLGVLIALALDTFMLREPKIERQPLVRGELRSVLRRAEVRWFLVSAFAMIFGHAALYVFYSLYLADLGYSKSEIGFFWTLGVTAEVIFFYFQSKVMSRFAPTTVLQLTFVIAVIRFILIGYFATTSLLILAQLMHAATFAAHHSASTKLIQGWFSGALQARGQALFTTVAYGFGGTLGGLCAGWIWDHWGPNQVFGMAAVACALAGVAIAQVKTTPNVLHS
jgi:PPP family 3-phenylpropionic acid transporter